MAAAPLICPSDMFGHSLLSSPTFFLLLPKLRLEHCVCIPAINAVQFLVFRPLRLFGRRRMEPFLPGLG